jgi:hypothetical protein
MVVEEKLQSCDGKKLGARVCRGKELAGRLIDIIQEAVLDLFHRIIAPLSRARLEQFRTGTWNGNSKKNCVIIRV